jgi:hypothetical protein
VISFGTGFDKATLAITGPKTTFRTTDTIAWSASLNDAANATTLHWVIAKVEAGNTEKLEIAQDVEISNPLFSVLANKAKLGTLLSGKGTYVMRYLREATVLAEGRFTLK